MNDHARLRLLILEDNATDLFLLQCSLRGCVGRELELLPVVRLVDALRLLGSQSIDLVLSDVNLPDSMGVETVRQLLAQRPAALIVVLTGDDDPRAHAEYLGAGAFACFCKTGFTTAGFEPVLAEALRRKRKRDGDGQKNKGPAAYPDSGP